MSILTVIGFLQPDGAQQMANKLSLLQEQHDIEVQDAAIAIWSRGERQPKAEQLPRLMGQGALASAFWGMLFALIFFVPYFGQELEKAIAALVEKFGDYGIDVNFISHARTMITEGTSALFLLTSSTVEFAVVTETKDQSFELIATNLPKAKEEELRNVFSTNQAV
jgi:uncharacterized membrane protein